MRKIIFAFFAASMTLCFTGVSAQKMFEGKKLKEVKEWSVEGSKKKLDHKTTYDANGKKSEEIEFNSLGDQKYRVTYTYNEKGKCIEEKNYDEFDKLEKTVKFEYFDNGKKKSQTTYLPNGKVKSYKEYEYITE